MLVNSVTASQVLVEEIRSMRESVVQDMRFEMLEALQQHEDEQDDRAASSRDPDSKQAKS